jgi:hypothetical protein
MKIAIHQPQYMPWLGFYHKMASADLFVLLNDVQFKKNEWQNRNRIRSSTGWQWLSVPTTYKFPQLICEVGIDMSQEWQKNHLASLVTCYSNSRFGKQYLSLFEEYYSNSFSMIDKINNDSVYLLATIMEINTPMVVSSDYTFTGSSTERLVNICRHFKADTYLAGAGGRHYMDLDLFKKANITVEFQEFSCPVYEQLWCKSEADFIPGLSALDLVFNCGDKSRSILMGNS